MTAGSDSRTVASYSDISRTVTQKFVIHADAQSAKIDDDPLSCIENEIFCVRFSPDSQYLAAAFGDGSIGIYNTTTGRRGFSLCSKSEEALPATQLRWRPAACVSKTKNVLVSVTAEGLVHHWHITSHKLLHEVDEPGNQLFCVDYVYDGSLFGTAGKNREVRIYDEATKRLSQVMTGGDSVHTPGHSNRVFSLKWHPTDRNVIVTGGWDSTIQFWDLRKGCAVKSIFGPHICGDAVDITMDGSTVLTGSWRVQKQLQLWDTGTAKLMNNISWRNTSTVTGISQSEPCMIYAAQFSKEPKGDTIIAGGSGSNEAKLFDRNKNYQVFSTIPAPRACYTVDISPDGTMIAVSGGDACVRIMNLR